LIDYSIRDTPTEASDILAAMPKGYDDRVLEVATELELTVKEGDFFRVLERILKSRVDSVICWYLRQVADGKRCLEFGDPIEVVIDLRTESVISGRAVKPEDVVQLFVTDAGPSRSVALVMSRPLMQGVAMRPAFRLTQRYVYDEQFKHRQDAISLMSGGRANDPIIRFDVIDFGRKKTT
jgi:hypothetical protein